MHSQPPALPLHLLGARVLAPSTLFSYAGRCIARKGDVGRVTGFRRHWQGAITTAVVDFLPGNAELNVESLSLATPAGKEAETRTSEARRMDTRAQRTLTRASLLAAARERLHSGVALNITHLAEEFRVTPVTARKWLADAGFDLSGLRRGRPKTSNVEK